MRDSAPYDRYVVLSDVVGSRRIEDRESFESQLTNAFDTLNRTHEASLAVPLSRMKGIDEFGCVIENLSAIPEIISTLLNHTHPVGVRFGIASGEIDVGISEDTVAEMDGPAFHRANQILQAVETDGLYVGLDTDTAYDGLASAALNFLSLHRMALSKRQVETILAYESSGTQSEAADELGVSQQAVSNTLQMASYYQTNELLKWLRDSFDSIYDE